uniref:Myosinlike protein putative n=1 Tax=Albugo laibachii Nc14 TaxID=890382 RepID=F0W018_9STRA|nr:myosinlike protein putative [Albugo laibachii Nc14]|eukprot:CCA14389.1 myosinlike protein putative [Albugo laibachii Nc14]
MRERDELPPHVYAISASSYREMRLFAQDQSILVSGESGAGKTETTKILMSHLAAVSPKLPISSTNDTARNVIERVLQSNLLMESFGNAKTSRNDNSSRFGKFTELHFNASGQLVGAQSSTHLLEKSRVSFQRPGEQNYHIFYQLLASGFVIKSQVQLDDVKCGDFPMLQSARSSTTSLREKLQLPDRAGETDEIIESSRGSMNCTSTDQASFNSTVDSLTTLGITPQIQVEIFKILSAIMYLSCLKFISSGGDNDECFLDSSDFISTRGGIRASQLLEVGECDLTTALTAHELSLTAVPETYTVRLNAEQAIKVRNSIATTLYSHLFRWLVNRVNTSTSRIHSEVAVNKICLLDIFGFENLEQNSYEQFCINYANEKLQQKFTEDIFKSIQLEYTEEGLIWPNVAFQDNLNIVTLIEGCSGILSLLYDEGLRPKGSDGSFTNRLREKYNDHGCLIFPRFNRDAFSIKHYAGFVLYETDGFLMKNSGAFQNDIMQLVRQSRSLFLRSLFSLKKNDGQAPAHTRRSQRRQGDRAHGTCRQRSMSIVPDTVGNQFKCQLDELLAGIRRTKVHYIRCINPNDCKSSSIFNKKQTLDQLRYSGVIEATRISRNAYPDRMLQLHFIKRFSGTILSKSAKPMLEKDIERSAATVQSNQFLNTQHRYPVYQSDQSDHFVRQTTLNLLQKLLPSESNTYQLGKKRVYFCKGVLEVLEGVRTRELHSKALLIQTHVKRWNTQIKYSRMKEALVQLQTWYRWYHFHRLYKRQRSAAIRIQCLLRCYLARTRYLSLRANHCAAQTETAYRKYHCCSNYRKLCVATIKIQSLHRMHVAIKSFRCLRIQAQNLAKLEKEAAMKHDSRSSRTRSFTRLCEAEVLEGADVAIVQLRQEIATLRVAISSLKDISPHRRKIGIINWEAYINSTSDVTANRGDRTLNQATEGLKTAHSCISSTIRRVKDHSQVAAEDNHLMEFSLNELSKVRNVLAKSLNDAMIPNGALQQESATLSTEGAAVQLETGILEYTKITRAKSSKASMELMTQSPQLRRQDSITSSMTSTQVSSSTSIASGPSCEISPWSKTSPLSLSIVHLKPSPASPDNPNASGSLVISTSQRSPTIHYAATQTELPYRSSIHKLIEYHDHDSRSDIHNSIISKLAEITHHVISDACAFSIGDGTESEKLYVPHIFQRSPKKREALQ